MPLEHNPSNELEKLLKYDQFRDTRERMDLTFSFFRNDEQRYAIPKKEGEWPLYIPVHARADANKMIDLLSYATIKLKIDLKSETEKERKELSNTEHTGIGMLELADTVYQDVPGYVDLQSSLAWYRVLRGWQSLRYWISIEDDGIVPDIAVWDTRNTYWVSGKRRLKKVCYIRWATEDEIKDEYGSVPGSSVGNLYDIIQPQYTADGNNLIPVFDIWDCSDEGKPTENGIAIGMDWVRDPEPVKLNGETIDFLPIRIHAGRSAPMIQDRNADNSSLVGDDYLSNTRDLLPTLARMGAYKLEAAGKEAKAPWVFAIESEKSDLPNAMGDKDPYVKGRSLFVDKSKGEEVPQPLISPRTGAISEMSAMLDIDQSKGGFSSVAYGQPPFPTTAQGTDILSHATMDLIKPFKQGVEKDLAWLATMGVRLYKLGNFDEQTFHGCDDKNNPFEARVSPDKVTEKPFKCTLVLDLIRDRVAEVGMAQTMIQTGISQQTAWDVSGLVEDTDAEYEKAAREHARGLFGIGELEAITELVEDYAKTKDPSKLFILGYAWNALQQAAQMGMSAGQPGNPQPGPGGQTPQATVRGPMSGQARPVPDEVKQAVRGTR